jgi:RNA polymerase sigma-70 factor (ECF subfamily)
MPDWESIVHADGAAVWLTGWRLLHNKADADECFQETFLAALRYSRTHAVTHWRALLTRLATARAVDRLRQRGRLARYEEPADFAALGASGSHPSQRAQSNELADRLRQALKELPPSQAEAFSLACLEDWSYQQIAQHMSITVDSVGVLIHRARQRLRQLLASMNEVSP